MGDSDATSGRSLTPWLVAGLSAVLIVAYGVRQARERNAMDARGGAPASAAGMEARGSAASTIELVEQAVSARANLDRGALERSIIELETARANDPRGEIAVALAGVLAAHAMEARMASHVTGPDAESHLMRARTSAGRAAILLEELQARTPRPDGLARVLADLEVARGGDVLARFPRALLPAPGPSDLGPIAIAMSALEQPASELPPGLLDQLRRQPEPRALLAVAVIQLHAGATAEAAATAADLLSRQPGHALATELRATGTAPAVAAPDAEMILEPEPEPETTSPVAVAPEPEPAPAPAAPTPPREPVATPKAKPAPTPRQPKPGPTPKEKPTSKVDALVDDGCQKVQSGNAQEGFEILTRAFDMQPGGNRVTLCLAEAHDALGRTPSALSMTERVLRRAPTNKSALLLAARLEAKSGNTAAARSHYQKVLGLDPDNATARAWLEKNG